MAILPNPVETQRVAPRPSRTVAGYNSGIEAQANMELGNNITAMAAEETQRLDAIMADDAETKLMAKELELQQEYSQIKGEGVLKPDFHKSFQDKYNAYKEEISRGLSTPAQRNRFETTAGRRAVGFDAHRVSYAMGEAERFEGVQHESRVKVLTDTAAAQYANPAAVATANMQLNDEIVKWGIKQGMSDPDIAAAYSKKVNGNFYSALIEQALINNDTSTANTLYAASSRFLSEEQNRSISSKLKVGNDYTEGQRIAVEAQAMLTAGKPREEVALFVAKARTPGAYQAAQTILTDLQQEQTKAQMEALGAVTRMYHEGGSNIKGKQKVLGSAEFKRLTDEQRTKVYDYIDADLQQDKSQARADIQFQWSRENHQDAVLARKDAAVARAEAKKYKSPEVMAEFARTITDKNLKNKSRDEIWGMAPALGVSNVEKILQEYETLNKGGKAVSLDSDLVKQGMPPEGFKNKQTAAAYEGTVKTLTMEWEAQNPGKKPTLEESKAIIRAANTEYSISSKWFNSDYTMYEEPPTKEAHAAEAAAKRDIIRDAALKGKTLTTKQIDEIYVKSLSVK